MLEFVSAIMTALSWVALIVMVGIFVLIVLGGFYMVSPMFRAIVSDFEMWDGKRRLRRHIRRGFSEGNPAMLAYAKADVEFTAQIFGRRPTFGTVYDEVAFAHQIDPREEMRQNKAQDAADQEIIDRATEYRNGISE